MLSQCNSGQNWESWAEPKWGSWAVGRGVAGCTTWGWSGPLKLINALKALIWYVYLEGTVFVSLGSTKNGVNRYMLLSY